MKVSVIVPLYKGSRYISNILRQLDDNIENLNAIDVELVLYNDYPDEVIEPINNRLYNIIVINPGKNQGIHGARVGGLKYATGEFVVFLDQDDKISPDYINCQIKAISNADVVVCNSISNQYISFNNQSHMAEKINIRTMLSEENYISSPGQVMIRRDVIPDIWKENIILSNGADDWFLWCCLMLDKVSFSFNSKVLFEHVIHNENTSRNALSMYKSIEEVVEKLGNLIDDSRVERKLINNFMKKYAYNYIGERDYYNEMIYTLENWIYWESEICELLIEKEITSVFIYGRGHIGVLIGHQLEKNGIHVDGFIDKKGPTGENDNVLFPSEFVDKKCYIIVSVVGARGRLIRDSLIDNSFIKVCCIEDLIDKAKIR